MICFHDYVMQSPGQAQGLLLEILAFVQHRFPDAAPRIYHGLPTFFYGKRDLINIGAYKDHFALYVGYDIVDYLKETYPSFRYTKGTIGVFYHEPFPFPILEDICNQIEMTCEGAKSPSNGTKRL